MDITQVSAEEYVKKYYRLKSIHELSAMSFQERMETASSLMDGICENHLYHYRRVFTSGSSPHARIKGAPAEMINLASNDYLNLTKHPQIIEAGIEALKQYGVGSGSVPMLAGTTDLHVQLEKRLAQFLEYESVILYNSGYAANYGVLTALLTSADVAILDTLVHASLVDGCGHSNKLYFLHNDLVSLEISLQKASKYANKLVIVDGIYSMDGDIALLSQIISLAHSYGAMVLVDDAHATGVMGKNGRGSQSHLHIREKAEIVSGSFGKALMGVGGFVAGSSKLINYLELVSRPYHFSSSLPPNVTASLIKALDILESDTHILAKLWQNIHYFKKRLLELGFNVSSSQSAIFPIILGNELMVLRLCAELYRCGILVNPIVFPVVPKRKSRLRLSITAGLTQTDLDYSLDHLGRLSHKLGIL